MNEISYSVLLEKARTSDEWHHHYLTPDCALNATNDFRIVLEADNHTYFTRFTEKPMIELEQLEKLFFNR